MEGARRRIDARTRARDGTETASGRGKGLSARQGPADRGAGGMAGAAERGAPAMRRAGMAGRREAGESGARPRESTAV